VNEASYRYILCTIEGGIATVILNRPEMLNSLNFDILAETRDALKRSMKAGVRVVIITGAGRGFCAGADLASNSTQLIEKSEITGATDVGTLLEEYYNPFVRDLMNLEVPLITALNGVAAGAGISVALMGDFIIASRSAVFKAGFVNIGLIPDLGGSWLLPRLAGRQRAMAIALLGEALTAEKAADWGLVHEVVDDSALSTRTQEIAEQISRLPAKTVAATKKAFRQAMENDLSAQLCLEVDTQRALGRTYDFREGVMAFLQKRTPKFEHR